jgi:cytoskeletal protein RodZ
MNTEDRLREAFRVRTSEIEPSPPSESLRKIEQRLAAARRAKARRRLLVGLTSAAAVLAVIVLAVAVTGNDDGREVRTANERTTTTSTSTTTSSSTTSTTERSSTTSGSTTTTSTSSTSTTTVPTSEGGGLDPMVMIWPTLGSSTRFDDPVAAAQSFAVDVVGFRDPVVGSFEADGSDGSSGTVAVRAGAQGPVTTVLVQQIDDGTWGVVSASTAEITLDQPVTGTQITCPLRVTGTALAFEGTVNVTVRDDQGSIGSGTVTGGGDVARPFDGTIDCSLGSASTGYGTVLLTEASAEDGSVVKAVARRVLLLAG